MRRWSILVVPAVADCGRPTLRSRNSVPAAACVREALAVSRRTQGPEEKEEGPAENAPEQKAESPALQPLPAWPQQREKTLQFFQLNGYIRFRAYLFHALNLGYLARARRGPRSPFHIPYSEFGSNGMTGRHDQPGRRAARRATSPTAAPTT